MYPSQDWLILHPSQGPGSTQGWGEGPGCVWEEFAEEELGRWSW